LVKGHSRSLKIVAFKSVYMISYLPSIVTMALSCIISEIKRDIIVVENRDFSYSLAFDAPVTGVSIRNIIIPFGMEKLE